MVTSERVQLHSGDAAPAGRDEVARRVARRRGSVPMPFAALLAWPALCAHVSDLGEYLRYDGTLPGRLRETAVLAVARGARCGFELSHHTPIAGREGVAPGSVDGSWADSPEDETAVGRYVEELVADWRVRDATHEWVRRFLDDAQIVELSVLAGYYFMIAAFINANQLQEDPQ